MEVETGGTMGFEEVIKYNTVEQCWLQPCGVSLGLKLVPIGRPLCLPLVPG